jgi:radical SAM superfamily enzyme YgiQ (UPF0313 family)
MAASASTVVANDGARRLRMILFLDYDDGLGGRFVNSPGLLPFVGSTRAAGFDVDFVTDEGELLRQAADPDVDVVGISSMERLLPRTAKTALQLRALRGDLVLMLGGNAIDPFAIDLAGGLFDVVVLGEGELVLPALLRSIATAKGYSPGVVAAGPAGTAASDVHAAGTASAGGALSPDEVDQVLRASFRRAIPGRGPVEIGLGNVFVRDSGRGVVWRLDTPKPPPLIQLTRGDAGDVAAHYNAAPVAAELDGLCMMPWDVMAREGWKHFEFYTQRGCKWGRCRFCSVASRQIRALTPGKVVEVIEQAVDRGIEVISFADDLFVQYPEWNWELLTTLRDRGIKARFRAQTMATRSVWPLLELMREVGFFEVAYGIETVDPVRVEMMTKSFNGRRYVDGSRETIERTAAAGIDPVLYMIMVDPESTLRTIAQELEDVVRFVATVYGRTGVVPKLSYSLVMLPVACTSVTAEYEYSVLEVPLQSGRLHLPTEFKAKHEVSAYLSEIDRATSTLRNRRENLGAIESYLRCAVEVADAHALPDAEVIRGHVERGLAGFAELTRKLDDDAQRSARALFEHAREGTAMPVSDRRFDYRRFGGYIAGAEQFSAVLSRMLQSEPEAVHRG